MISGMSLWMFTSRFCDLKKENEVDTLAGGVNVLRVMQV
jgi:hypothetical protein